MALRITRHWRSQTITHSAEAAISRKLSSGAVLIAYLTISIGYFGLVLLREVSQAYLGYFDDPAQFTWMLAWWPYAFAHSVNPFFTRMMWAPVGYNLTWAPSIPALSLLASPITYLLGPLVSYNVLSLIAPALDAWAGFLLCRLLGVSGLSAFIGGYVFGFSPYLINQVLGGHLNFTFMMWIPLAVYLCVKRLCDEIRVGRFLVLFVLVAVAEFLTSTENFATMTIMGVTALLVTFAVGGTELRYRLIGLLEGLCVAYLIAATLLSPFLYYVFAFPQHPFVAGVDYHASPVGLVTPTKDLLLSPHQILALFYQSSITLSHKDFCAEASLYLSPIALALVWLFAAREWQTWRCKALLITLALAWILSLGAGRTVHGFWVPLPWAVFHRLPLITEAIPVRFSLYCYMSLAIVMALAIDDLKKSRSRICAALLVIAFYIPAVRSTNLAVTRVNIPEFFATDLYKSQIRKGEIILGMPVGQTMILQARTGMYFRLAGGYPSGFPREFERNVYEHLIPTDGSEPRSLEGLRSLLAKSDATAVLVDSKSPASFDLRPIVCARKLSIGGVVLCRLSLSDLGNASRTLQDPIDLATVPVQCRLSSENHGRLRGNLTRLP
jgi:hypothetical protein